MIISPNMAIQGCILAGGNGCKPVFPIASISATSLGIAKDGGKGGPELSIKRDRESHYERIVFSD